MRGVPAVAWLLALLCLTAGCARGCASSRPPIHPNPNMDYQEKSQPFEASRFFYDGVAMRLPVPGTVARGTTWVGDAFVTGRDAAGEFVARMPVEQDPALLERGAQRFGIYCAPCHDPRGYGAGILFNRGGIATTSLHDPRVRELPDGEIFDVISNGLGLMPSYRYPIPAADRWAIIAHVRRLQAETNGSKVASSGTEDR